MRQPPRPKGKRKTQDPCEGCSLHRDLCLCADIPKLQTKSRLSLVIHAKEMKRTTNTGLLATRALMNSEVFVRGLKDRPLDLSPSLTNDYDHLLFYPCEGALDISAFMRTHAGRPIHLIVPDGNWRQASKVAIRHEELRHLPRVMIQTPNRDVQHLRAETTDVGMATLQAIALAFGVLESPEVEEALTRLYRLKLERTLRGRGIF